MRRTLAAVACVVAILGFAVPPVFAQAPAPKVTITGLFDQVTATGSNFYDGNYTRTNDKEWYARTRFRPDFEFAVGRTKAVLGLEIDLTYGQSGANDGGFPGNVTGAACGKAGSNGCLDLNTDVGGMLEVKWIYTEFDLTGKDSLMPFIPVPTVARAGGQPFATLANYRATYAAGDFGGISSVTTFAPNLKLNLAYIQVEETLAGQSRGVGVAPTVRGADMAVIVSPEFTPFKGLDIKPLYSYFGADGSTNGNARRTVSDVNLLGGTTGAGSTPRVYLKENRHTVGLDARWRSGPFSLDPTVFYQWGDRDMVRSAVGGGGTHEADVSAWLVDIQGGFQAGPLLLEVRGIYSTGNKATDNLSRKIRYYEPLDLDTNYYINWAQILALGVDYFNGGGGSNGGMSTNVGYDRYGRAQFGVRATYSLTPALAFYGIVSPTWTAEKVDTNTNVVGGLRTAPTSGGDSRYIGTEADLGMTWRFAPNVAFDLVGAYLFAGGALDTQETVNGVVTHRDSRDAWTSAARVRLSF